ncbi:ABC transporter permease, partial [Burkholderia sp. SIMBA_048]|uniref:ABC transporter permease n=1 Tax=Burkholderia sp. SIMBA_048 TaxID=3085789 RepID=UPI003978FDD9
GFDQDLLRVQRQDAFGPQRTLERLVGTALAIARYRFPGRGALTSFFLSPMMIPAVVLGIAFLRFLSMLHLSGSFWALVATHVIVVLPYAL